MRRCGALLLVAAFALAPACARPQAPTETASPDRDGDGRAPGSPSDEAQPLPGPLSLRAPVVSEGPPALLDRHLGAAVAGCREPALSPTRKVLRSASQTLGISLSTKRRIASALPDFVRDALLR